jgi:hypothetical protein
MNVDIGTEAAQFPEKEYINGMFFAVRKQNTRKSEIINEIWEILFMFLFT